MGDGRCELGVAAAGVGMGRGGRGRPIPATKGCGAVLGEALGGARARWTAMVSPTRVRQGGMATVAVLPGMATNNATNWVLPACN